VHRLIKNRLLPALALAAALISPSAHAQAASGNDPIKLGLIDIYSGGFAFIADSIRTGFQIAVDEANAAGGLKGRPFQLVSADMGGQVEKAVTEGRRMILEDKIKFVTVGIHSGAAIAVGNLGKEHKVLVTGGFATTKRLTGESGHPYISRANLSTVEIGSVIAEYIKARPDIKRISTIAPDYEYGQQFIEDFMRALKAARPDVVVVRQEWSKLGATDFSAHVTALQAQPVDLIVNGGFGADLVNLLKASKDFGLNVNYFTLNANNPGTPTQLGSWGENKVGVVWNWISNANTPELEKIHIAYKKKYNEDFIFAAHWNTMNMLSQAIKQAKSTDPKKVAFTLEGMSYKSPLGEVKMRKTDHQLEAPLYLGMWAKQGSKGVKHDSENTGYGFRTEAVWDAYISSQPTSCQMKRPSP
jgi:branched-chain amino acid transport system substrate-binding protein